MPQALRPIAITVNWNRANDTLECIDSLFKGIQDVRVLVVDNGSTDGSVPLLKERYPDLEMIENDKNLGYVKGANQGVRRALELDASHILLINNDAIARPGMLGKLMDAMEKHPQAGVVGPKIFYYGTDMMWFNGGHFNHLLGLSTHPLMDRLDDGGDQDREVEFITGCAMLVRSQVFREIGLFDEDFEIYTEDLDFCLRAKDHGYGVWLVPGAVAEHKVSISTGVSGSNLMTPYRSYFYARNMLMMVRKRKKGFRFMTCFLGQTFILIPYYFFLMGIQRTKGSFRQYLRGYAHAFKGILEGRYG